MLCVATMINYMDRQVLSLTWKDFIAPQFAWKDSDYGMITAFFSITYAVCMFFAGKFIDWQGVKKGYMWAVAIWSLGAIMHAFCGVWACGVITGEWLVGFDGARETLHDAGMAVLPITTLTVYLFMGCRFCDGVGTGRKLPCGDKSNSELFSQERPCLCYSYIQ